MYRNVQISNLRFVCGLPSLVATGASLSRQDIRLIAQDLRTFPETDVEVQQENSSLSSIFSGCGKSTPLNVIAGIVVVDGGEVSFTLGNDDISYVF